MKGSCFQCGGKKTTIKAIFNDHGHKGYFCDVECLQKFTKKDVSCIDSKKKEILNRINSWQDDSSNYGYYGAICAMVAEPGEIVFVNKTTTCYLVGKCQDSDKITRAFNYVSTIQGSCVIL